MNQFNWLLIAETLHECCSIYWLHKRSVVHLFKSLAKCRLKELGEQETSLLPRWWEDKRVDGRSGGPAMRSHTQPSVCCLCEMAGRVFCLHQLIDFYWAPPPLRCGRLHENETVNVVSEGADWEERDSACVRMLQRKQIPTWVGITSAKQLTECWCAAILIVWAASQFVSYDLSSMLGSKQCAKFVQEHKDKLCLAK